jgi:hypothetical protein
MNDTLVKLAGEGAARFPRFPLVSATFLSAIDWSLAVAPGARPQCVEDLREALVSAAKRRVSRRVASACLAFAVAGACAVGLSGSRFAPTVPQPLAQAPLVESKVVARDADKASARETPRKRPPSPTTPTTSTAALAASPRAACAGLGIWASSACMRRECSSPGRRQHPDCMRLQADEDARLQREYSR